MRNLLCVIVSLCIAIGLLSCGGGSSSNVDASDPFYDVGNVQPGLAPGALVRTATYPSSTLTGSVNSRIMYMSVDGNGVAVPTTAAVAIPNGTPPTGGWPVVAWAHGTTGVGQNCAPSLTSNLSYDEYQTFVQALLSHGYAVVATDFSGLGTTGRHFYDNRVSNARDTIESVRAATVAYPSLSKSFVVIGHSEGGGAAVGVAETIGALSIAPLQYKGTVAMAPDVGLTYYYFQYGLQNGAADPTTLAYFLYIAYSVKLSNPGLSYSDELLPDAVAAMPAAEQQCLLDLGNTLAASNTFPNNFVQPAWLANPILTAYEQKNASAQVKATGPMFVAWGSDDTTIILSEMNYLVSTSCGLGSDVHFKAYPGADHNGVLTAALNDIFQWIGQQFSGTYTSPLCGT